MEARGAANPLNVADIHTVHDIVEHVYQLRRHSRNSQTEQQPSYTVMP